MGHNQQTERQRERDKGKNEESRGHLLLELSFFQGRMWHGTSPGRTVDVPPPFPDNVVHRGFVLVLQQRENVQCLSVCIQGNRKPDDRFLVKPIEFKPIETLAPSAITF